MSDKFDKKIINCLEKGLFVEVLQGDSKCFVYDSYYRGGHDVLLVVSTMIKWARDMNYTEIVSDKFVDALSEIMKSNLIMGLDILNCYLIVSEDLKYNLQIDFDVLSESANIGEQMLKDLTDDDKLKINSLMAAISKRTVKFDFQS